MPRSDLAVQWHGTVPYVLIGGRWTPYLPSETGPAGEPAGGGAAGGGSGGAGAASGASGAGADDDGNDPPDLGDAGKRALAAERALKREESRQRRAAEQRAQAAEAELAQLREASQSEQERALAKAREEADQAARKEVTGKFARILLASKVEVAAAGKFADPSDAVALLDLDEFTVGDDGKVDRKAIDKALDDLLKEKPHLSADPKLRRGSAEGGARTDTTAAATAAPGLGRLRAAYTDTGK